MPRLELVGVVSVERVLLVLSQLMERRFRHRPLDPLLQVSLDIWCVGKVELHRLDEDLLVGGLLSHCYGQVGVELQRSDYRKLLVEQQPAYWEQVGTLWSEVPDIKQVRPDTVWDSVIG